MKKVSLLIVDDSSFMREMLREIVESKGFNVIAEARDGCEASYKYKDHHPDLVIMDLVMPRKSGIEAVKEILVFDPWAKIVMSVALGQERLALEALQAGAKDYFTKPYEPDDVLGKLRKALQRKDRA